MENWQVENSEKLEISEIAEKIFRLFVFILQSNRKLGFKNLGKKFQDFRVFRVFRVFDVAVLFSIDTPKEV